MLAERLHRVNNTMRVLVVTPHVAVASQIAERLAGRADVDVCYTFGAARRRLVKAGYDVLMTELRLDEYNGLHLVHLARDLDLPVRCVVFTASFDRDLASQAIAAHAFYEHAHRIAVAAPAYLRASLPTFDRRDPASFDRRSLLRGGRRAADLGLTLLAGAV